MVAWKDGEPEIKIGFKRYFAKGIIILTDVEVVCTRLGGLLDHL